MCPLEQFTNKRKRVGGTLASAFNFGHDTIHTDCNKGGRATTARTYARAPCRAALRQLSVRTRSDSTICSLSQTDRLSPGGSRTLNHSLSLRHSRRPRARTHRLKPHSSQPLRTHDARVHFLGALQRMSACVAMFHTRNTIYSTAHHPSLPPWTLGSLPRPASPHSKLHVASHFHPTSVASAATQRRGDLGDSEATLTGSRTLSTSRHREP